MNDLIPSQIRNNPLALLAIGLVAGYFFASRKESLPAAIQRPQDVANQLLQDQSKKLMEQAQDLISSI